jgi:ribosomal-protein-serine acetyltransferase
VCGVIGLDPIEKHHERASIGYWLAERAQGRGRMTRALDAVVRHAFDTLALNRVSLYAATGNVRSRAVAERVGFVQEGVHRQAEKTRGRYLDMVAYALLRSDHRAAPKEFVSPTRMRELSKKTLFGRVHELVRFEARRDVAALIGFVDPGVQDSRRGADESERARIEALVGGIRTAAVEDVAVLHAAKVSPEHGGRPAARVRTVVRYNEEAEPVVTESEWVRERGVWYTTRYPLGTP